MKRIIRGPLAAYFAAVFFFAGAQGSAQEASEHRFAFGAAPTLQMLQEIGGAPSAPAGAFAPGARSIPMEAVPRVEPEASPAEPRQPQLEEGLSQQDMEQIYAMAALIKTLHVDGDKITSQKLYYAAVRGMAKEMDPHSQFFDPKEFKDFQALLDGTFSGIGAGMSNKEKGKGQGILYTMPNSPAEKAGLKGGDVIVEINGENVGPMEQEEVVNKVKGPKGTPVTLKIARLDPKTGGVATFTVTVTRDQVETANAFAKMYPNRVGYIYFDSFRDNTADTVLALVRKLKAQGATSLIIDIRNNGGGSVQTVWKLTSAFLRQGQAVVSMRDRKGATQTLSAPKDGEFKDLPLKVLVNGYSASASEIFSGAIQDYHRGTIIGSQTYGKGTAQTIIPFPDGSALKLTINKWYTPLGHSIQKDDQGHGGVTPDVSSGVSEEDEMKAMGRIMRELNGMPPDANPVPDPTLAKALQ